MTIEEQHRLQELVRWFFEKPHMSMLAADRNLIYMYLGVVTMATKDHLPLATRIRKGTFDEQLAECLPEHERVPCLIARKLTR